jgi:hypothetical protein
MITETLKHIFMVNSVKGGKVESSGFAECCAGKRLQACSSMRCTPADAPDFL